MVCQNLVFCVILVLGGVNSNALYSVFRHPNQTLYKQDSGVYVSIKKPGNTSTEEVIILCQDGDVYKTLSSCQAQCSGNVTKDNGVKETYKMVVFNQSEFKILTNRTLVLKTNVPFKTFTPQHYFLINNCAHVCYPLNPKLNNCVREVFTLSDQMKIKFFNDTRTSNIEWHSIGNISISDFFISNEGLVTCKSFPELITLNMIGFLVSDVALIITMTMTLLIPSLRRKNNEALLCHMLMLFFSYSIITWIYILPVNVLKSLCPTLAFFEQFCYLSAFAWMNILFSSLYKAFTSLLPVAGFSIQRFLTSCIYACGVPLLITLATVAAQLLKVPVINPRLEESCWFAENDKFSALLYFYAPMAGALMINTFYFLRIVLHMHYLGKELASVNKRIHRQVFVLSLKLVFVMGIYWIAKVVVWATDGVSDIWRYIDVVNSFQGVFIFLVYAPNPKKLYKDCTSPNRFRTSTIFNLSTHSLSVNTPRKKLNPVFKRQTM